MKRGVLIIALLLSLAIAAECDNEFTLYVNDTKSLDNDVFELIESGDHYSDIELEIDGDDMRFGDYYEVTDDWLIYAIEVTPDWCIFRASKFFSESENEEVKMNTCDKSALEIKDKEILMMKSTYPSARFSIDGEEILLDTSEPMQYVGDTHLINLVSKSGSHADGTTTATIELIPLEKRTIGLSNEFTLRWGERAAAKVDGKTIKLLPENPSKAIIWRGETFFVPPTGDAIPLDEDYAIRVTDSDNDPASISLMITKIIEPTRGRLELDCIGKPYGELEDGSYLGFQKALAGDRAQLRHGDSYSTNGIGAQELSIESGWAFFAEAIESDGDSCSGTVYASKKQAGTVGQLIALDITRNKRAASFEDAYNVFLMSADGTSATMFVNDVMRELDVGDKLSNDGYELELVTVGKDTAVLVLNEELVPTPNPNLPEPPVGPEPTATPEPTSTPEPTKSPSTGLVTGIDPTERGVIGMLIDWLVGLLGL
ncbi:hypothetical protein ACFLQ2_01715 [archaeon]